MRIIFHTLLTVLLICPFIYSQNFSGIFSTEIYGETISVELLQNGENINGKMISYDSEYNLNARKNKDKIKGTLSAYGENHEFTAWFTDGNLNFQIINTEEPEEALVLKPQKNNQNPPAKSSKNTKVIINGITLSDKEINQLQKTYNVKPLPGNYWYDKKSGLYGVVGYQAFGFMKPDHSFGTLKENASNGNTQVFVNGRQLPQTEWAIWSQLLGYYIQPGRYWLHADGNAGYEGNPTPTENLYSAAQRNAYRNSGGGDNFWSTRFSAGSSNADNSQGYVSVPGYGPVGYGF